MIPELYDTSLWLAKIKVAQPVAPPIIQPQPFVFSGMQFFVSLVAGLLMAFAFQFLLTNLSLAAGISTEDSALETKVADSWSSKVQEIESKVGVWALITVNIALFTACYLAVKLTLINSVTLGAITGVVIWSAFFLVLLWLSSKTVSSLVGSAMNSASSGLQGIMGIATTALGGKAVNAQVVNTVQESVASVRREMSSTIDPTTIRESLEDYVSQLKSPEIDVPGINKNFEKILRNSNLKAITDGGDLKNIDSQSLKELVSSSTNLSEEEINQVASSLQKTWKKVFSQQQSQSSGDLQNLLQSLPDQIVPSLGGGDQQGSSLGKQAIQYGIAALFSTMLDGEEIRNQLKRIPQQITSGLSEDGNSQNTIKSDVKDYLLNSKPWHLNRETIKEEFQEVIHDSEANPKMVRQQLEQLNQDFLVKSLQQRDELSSDKVQTIAEQLEGIRQDVLEQVKNAESEQQSNNLRSQIEDYLRSTDKEELNPEGIEKEFKTILQDPEAGFEQLRDRVSQFDRDTLQKMLSEAKPDLSDEEANNILDRLESVQESVISNAKDAQEEAKAKAEEFGQKVESYLRDTGKEELKPEGIKKDLQKLVDEPQEGAKAIRERLSQFNRDTLVQLLSKREDLSEAEINQFVNQFLEVRDNLLQAPSKLAGKAKEEYEQAKDKVANYLRNTELEELNPQGIQQDLNKLFDDPQEGVKSLKDRLSQMDRETVVKLLSQREDLSEDKVNEIADNVQNTLKTIAKTPRRLAERSAKKVQSWESQLEDYLRDTEKEELNPQGIKRDLKTLVQQPGSGFQQIQERVSKLDRESITSLLSQREDISEDEANQIVDRIESVRDSMFEQAQKAKEKAQEAVDGVFDQVRNYLNSMERSELNYEGIKQDVQKLFHDPEAGVDQLRDRVSQFDRDTLVAVLSANPALSKADADRAISKIEQVRDRVLTRAERLQEQAEQKVEKIQAEAKQQLQQARKVTATASWWLFGTALTSVGMAAFAGMVAVRGLNLFS